MTGPVLVVEDDAPVREALGQTLELAGFTPTLAGSFVVAKDHMHPGFEGVILSDVRMPGRDGLYLLDHVQSIDPDLPVILLTGEADIPTAVGAVQKGAFDFLEKPCSNDVLVETVARAMKARALVTENRRLKAMVAEGDAAERMIFGVSDKVKVMRDQVRRLASLDEPVLIEGAPGAGIDKIVIASGLGSENLGQSMLDPALYPEMHLYVQNDPTLPGFNPNDEHAHLVNTDTGKQLYALRNDLHYGVSIDYYALEDLAHDEDRLLDAIDAMLFQGRMAGELREAARRAIQAAEEPRDRVRNAIYVAATSAEFQVEH